MKVKLNKREILEEVKNIQPAIDADDDTTVSDLVTLGLGGLGLVGGAVFTGGGTYAGKDKIPRAKIEGTFNAKG